jgi:histidinol-phosphatase (PHP family)
MIPHDYHMHSNFSCDCHARMADMCAAAVARGVAEIGFSEHYDLFDGETANCRDYFRLEPWAAELARQQTAFAGRLTIRAGIEIGEPHLFRAEAQALLARYPFDYVLGSLHWVGAHSIFDSRYFEARAAKDAFRLFYEELERMTAVGGFDILSHFDVPVRTAFAVYGRYAAAEHEQYLRPVLRNCIERGIALDLNTAALRRRAQVLTPGLEILRIYVEMGGERVTLGSDAHRPDQVGSHLDTAMQIAHQAGLKYLTHFEKREARLVEMPVTA